MVHTRSKRSPAEADKSQFSRPLKVTKKVTKKKTGKVSPPVVEQAVSSGEQQIQQHQAERPLLVSCRKAESEKLLLLLKSAISTRQGTAVYIPGHPGTGKTLTVRNVLSHFPWRELQESPPVCTLVNCMDSVSCLARVCLAGLREAAAIVSAGAARGFHSVPVVAANACTLHKEDNNDSMKEIRKLVATGSSKPHKGMYILVLDELDQACKKTNETVADIFALSTLSRSRLVVISIANRLDLASRVLQPTGLAHTAAPHVVPFRSYTARQLLELLEEQYPGQFQPRALELIAKRISAATGDMRTALAVCNAARTAAARSILQSSSADAAGVSHSQHGGPNHSTGCTAGPSNGNTELISVSQAAEALRVCSSGGSAQAQGHVARIQALPTQQQLLLCTLAIARGAAQGATSPTPSASVSTFRTLQPFATAPSTPTPLAGDHRSQLSTSMRQGSISSLLAARRTPLADVGTKRGFGLGGGSGAQVPKKATFKSFPMPDDIPGFTPTSVSASAGATGKKGAEAAMTLKAAFEKYKVRGQEAGIKVMGSSLQLESLVDDLKSAGLLEAAGKKGGRTTPRENMQLQLCVSTDDVKHALSDNRMLQPLVCQLP